MTEPSDQLHIIPAHRLFWAKLNPPKGRAPNTGSASGRSSLGYMFERFLPCSIEQVHAVYANDGDSVLACGMLREQLQTRIDHGALRVQPDAVPQWLESKIEPASLNLAVFEATPPVVRSARTRLAATCSLVACAALTLTAFGLQRRASVLNTAAIQLRQASDAGIVQRLGPSMSGQLPQMRLTAELRRLRALDSSSESYAGAADAVLTLQASLQAWPEGVLAQTESLTATGSAMRMRTQHESTASADAFASSWKPDPEQWTARQPSMTTQRDQVRLELVCERKGDE